MSLKTRGVPALSYYNLKLNPTSPICLIRGQNKLEKQHIKPDKFNDKSPKLSLWTNIQKHKLDLLSHIILNELLLSNHKIVD